LEGRHALQEKGYVTADVADAEGLHQLKLSGTKFRKMLRAGEDIPEWCVCRACLHAWKPSH
jgi:ATP sulfurylase